MRTRFQFAYRHNLGTSTTSIESATFTHGYAVTSQASQGKTVDHVLLVASSRSFGAVNREQFYVSISRGRERVQVFTDDAELLARRVTAGGERKAAVELQALRDDLAKLGLGRKAMAKISTPSRFRTVRPMRVTRLTRLAPVQRLVQVVEEVARWIGERFGIEAKQEVVQPKQVEAPKQVETVRRPRTVREVIEQRKAARRHRPGIVIKPPSDTGHSRGIGV